MTMNARTLAKALLAATLIGSGACYAETLEIAGSTTIQKSIIEPTSAKLQGATGAEVKMLGVGTGKGMQMLFDGKVKVAAVSDTLDDSIAHAKKVGVTTVPAGLKMHTLATDELVPIVHPDNPVKELSKDQLRGLLSGKVQNWKEVGGGDLAVTVVSGAPGSSTRAIVEKQLLSGVGYGTGLKELRSTAAEIGEVARDKGAIGYVGGGVAEASGGKVKEVKAAKLTRPLALVTIGEPTPTVRKLIDYLQTPEAKKLFIQ